MKSTAPVMNHIPREVLERFLDGKATRQEGRQIVAHLLRGCRRCAAPLRGRARAPVPSQVYEEIIDRVTRRIVAEWGACDLPALRKVSVCSPW